ncbi:hypothetical protein BH11PSE8_BH11PSE8_48120 [soil metagenome]
MNARSAAGGKPQRSLKGRALQLLAQREQSRVELRRKLLVHARAEDAERLCAEAADAADAAGLIDGAGPQAAERVEAVLDWLEAHRYLSAERFAESRVHARSSRFGNLRIRQELKQHAVSLSPEAGQALRESEVERACAVRERKFPNLPKGAAEMAKQARFLTGRGFSPEAIRRALRDAPEGQSGGDADTGTGIATDA